MTLRTGERVPEVSLRQPDGSEWRLADHRGSVVVLIFHRHLA